jgi:hypothetical protein
MKNDDLTVKIPLLIMDLNLKYSNNMVYESTKLMVFL